MTDEIYGTNITFRTQIKSNENNYIDFLVVFRKAMRKN